MRKPFDPTRPLRRPIPSDDRQALGLGDPQRSEAVERDYRHLVEISAQDDAERQRGIRFSKVISGDPTKPYIALTFDDGPHGSRTSALLDTLRRLSIPATFFVVGMQAQKYPELIRQMALEGHEVANHTYNHYRLTRIPAEEIADELNRTRDLLADILNQRIRLFRPPGGDYTPEILRVAERNGYVMVLWTDDPADFAAGRTESQIEGFVLRDITPGGIILLHDGVQATLNVLPHLVSRLQAQGYEFVTVSDLIRRGGGLQRVREIRISRTSAH